MRIITLFSSDKFSLNKVLHFQSYRDMTSSCPKLIIVSFPIYSLYNAISTFIILDLLENYYQKMKHPYILENKGIDYENSFISY